MGKFVEIEYRCHNPNGTRDYYYCANHPVEEIPSLMVSLASKGVTTVYVDGVETTLEIVDLMREASHD